MSVRTGPPGYTRRTSATNIGEALCFLLIALLVASSMCAAAVAAGQDSSSPPVVLRLHLVRHGETESNRENLVLGQRESPLTETGLNQARALGTSPTFGGRRENGKSYWRAYSSDYDRTRRTAGMVLGGDDGGEGEDGRAKVKLGTSSDDCTEGWRPPLTVVMDRRLRERAKGVREGYPKVLSFEEALDKYRSENPDASLPLLESDDDVWDRFKGWVDDLLAEICTLEENSNASDSSDEHGVETVAEGDYAALLEKMKTDEEKAVKSGINTSRRRRIYNVLAVSHSATIRTAVNRMVSDQLPSGVARGPVGRDGIMKGMLVVPNTSVTVIDVVPGAGTDDAASADESDKGKKAVTSIPWTATLVELTNTDHLVSLE